MLADGGSGEYKPPGAGHGTVVGRLVSIGRPHLITFGALSSG